MPSGPPEILSGQGRGHKHWIWKCAACEYGSPFFAPTEEVAAVNLAAHKARCPKAQRAALIASLTP